MSIMPWLSGDLSYLFLRNKRIRVDVQFLILLFFDIYVGLLTFKPVRFFRRFLSYLLGIRG